MTVKLALGVMSVLAIAYVLRVIPHWLARSGAGVDHWFWKTYIETYRRERRFPPHLPQYVLDEAQWYPPVFPMLLARLPAVLFDRFSQQIATVIDLARMSLLLGLAYWQSDGTLTVIVVAGLLYAATPIQVSYNIQLNPRGLGAIMLDAMLVMLFWYMSGSGGWPAWAIAAVLGGLVSLTHKMTTQLMWFVIAGTAIIYQRWEIAAIAPASVAAAMALSRGFYWKVLLAHYDIVRFWARHWRWLGADPVRESPIYGEEGYERGQKLHKSGVRGFAWHCFMLFGFNPAAWISCLLLYERLFVESALLIYPTPLLVWLLLPCAFACLTTFVPALKCLGAGYLYLYNTSLLAPLILALTFQYTRAPELSKPLVAVALLLNVVGLAMYYREFRGNKRTRVDANLARMLEELRARPRGLVMCLPTNWAEVVAYKTGHPVLWGAHGYGFRRLEPIWPRLLLPIAEIVTRYDVRYLLTMDAMLTPQFERELPANEPLRHGEYRLYRFADGRDPERRAGLGEMIQASAQSGVTNR